ncbi:MAG: hypothetical protein IPH28_23265 [Cytophagaceae bacterium]|nr:hypothetical protein [Cytophagaceae bacterium]
MQKSDGGKMTFDDKFLYVAMVAQQKKATIPSAHLKEILKAVQDVFP